MINGYVCERYTYKCISGIRIMISTTQDSKLSFAMIDLFSTSIKFHHKHGKYTNSQYFTVGCISKDNENIISLINYAKFKKA